MCFPRGERANQSASSHPFIMQSNFLTDLLQHIVYPLSLRSELPTPIARHPRFRTASSKLKFC